MAQHFKEFPDLEIPEPFTRNGWEDRSWHNDACGTVVRKLFLEQSTEYPLLRLWVEYDDIAKREIEDSKFVLELVRREEDWCNGLAEGLYFGEDIADLLIRISEIDSLWGNI